MLKSLVLLSTAFGIGCASNPLGGGPVSGDLGTQDLATSAPVIDAFGSKRDSLSFDLTNPALNDLRTPEVDMRSSIDLSMVGPAMSVLSGLSMPFGIAISSGTIFVADNAVGTIVSVPTSGGVMTVIASNQQQPWGVVADNTFVYWTDYGTGPAFGSVMKIPLSGVGPPTFVATIVQPSELAIDSTNLYVVTAGEPQIVSLMGGPAIPFGGWPTEGNYPYPPQFTTATAGNFCFGAGPLGASNAPVACFNAQNVSQSTTDNADLPLRGVAVDADRMFASGGNRVTSHLLNSPAGQWTTLADAQNSPGPIATDSTYAYWLQVDLLMKAPVDGSSTAIALATNTGYVPGASHIALDSSTVYWTSRDGIRKAPKTGIP